MLVLIACVFALSVCMSPTCSSFLLYSHYPTSCALPSLVSNMLELHSIKCHYRYASCYQPTSITTATSYSASQQSSPPDSSCTILFFVLLLEVPISQNHTSQLDDSCMLYSMQHLTRLPCLQHAFLSLRVLKVK